MQPLQQNERDGHLLEIDAEQKCTQKHTYAIYMACLLLFTINLIWFCPAGYQTPLKSEPYLLSIFDFNIIYTIGYLPKTVLIFASSWFILKIGVESVMMICFFGIAATQLIMYAIFANRFSLWYEFLLFDKLINGFFVMTAFLAAILTFFKYFQPKTRYFTLTIVVCGSSVIQCVSRNVYMQISEMDSRFFLVLSQISIVLLFLSIGLFYAFKRQQRESLQDKTYQQQQSLQIKNINKIERAIMMIIFITGFLASSISNSVKINEIDMLYERTTYFDGKDEQIWYMLSHFFIIISWAIWLITIKNQLNKKKMRFTYVIGAICLASVLVLFFIPDKKSGSGQWMALFGLCLMHIWKTGVIVSILAIIQLIVKNEFSVLALSVFISGLALGSGLAPLMSAKIISESGNYQEGYKNTCYLYLTVLTFMFVGLMYQSKNQNKLMMKLMDQKRARLNEVEQLRERTEI